MGHWWIYIRVSTEDQAEHGVSLDAQLASCRAYAQARGWNVAGHEVDDISGGTMRRPGLQAILARVRDKSCAGVLIWKLDRLSRRLEDLLAIARTCEEAGASLACVTEPIDTTNPGGRLMFHLLGSFAQHERETISHRVSTAMKHAAEQGWWLGSRALPGLRVVPAGNRKKLERGDHADVVATCWARILAGDSLLTVAKAMRAAEVPCGSRRGWSSNNVRNLLLSPRAVPLLVDAGTQARVRVILAKRGAPGRPAGSGTQRHGTHAQRKTALAGLVRCPVCDCQMVQVSARGVGGVYHYLRCNARAVGACTQRDLSIAKLEPVIFQAIGQIIRRGEYRAAILADQEKAAERAQAARISRAKLLQEREQIDARLDELAFTGTPRDAGYLDLANRLAKRLLELDTAIAGHDGTIAAHSGREAASEWQISLIEGMAADRLEKAEVEDQAALLAAMVDRITPYPDRLVLDLFAINNEPPPIGGSSYTNPNMVLPTRFELVSPE